MENEETLKNEEYFLASQLKDLCEDNGREKDVKKSAEVFHKLGLIYAKRAPDKICLIQSATLLNAAISRKPHNVSEVEDARHKLCAKILAVAKANADSDLVRISQSISQGIDNMRSYAAEALDSLKDIPEDAEGDLLKQLEKQKIRHVKEIQDRIASDYSTIMKDLSDECIRVMGELPCKFALVGMGSLARKEITPYSDFENVIILEENTQEVNGNYEHTLEYFRWFAVIFQIVLVNLGETIIPSVAIPSLNDFTTENGDWFFDSFTTRGVSFDGLMPHACKSPLGRQSKTGEKSWKTELIKPIDDMVKYLDSGEDLKNGYHLADILTKTCFVAGDQELYEKFLEKSNSMIESQRRSDPRFLEELAKQVDKDKSNFATWKGLAHLHKNIKSNMKSIIYRSTTIFISALGKYYDVGGSSCFDIIENLAKKGYLSSEDEHALTFAIAIACEVRLKVYMKNRSQNDWVKKTVSQKKYLTELFDTVGEKTIVRYFVISDLLHESLPDFCQAQTERITLPKIDFCEAGIYYFLNMYEKSIELFRAGMSEQSSDSTKMYCKLRIGYALNGLKQYNDAISEFQQVLEIMEKLPYEEQNKRTICKCHHAIADCLVNCMKYEEALYHFKQDLANQESPDKVTINNNGVAFLKLKRYSEAMACFLQAIEITNNQAASRQKTLDTALFEYNVGRCYYEEGNFAKGQDYLQQSLHKRRQMSPEPSLDKNIALSLYNIGRCMIGLDQFEDAITQINEGLVILKAISLDVNEDIDVANSYHHIGKALSKLNKNESALKYFENEKAIRICAVADINTKESMASCLEQIELTKACVV